MSRVLPGAALLVGVVIGGLIVAVGLDRGSDQEPEGSPDTSQTSGTPTAADTTVTVPAACGQAVDAVDEAVKVLRDGAAAARDFQPDKLVEVLNRLEDIDAELTTLATRCSAVSTSPPP